MRSSCRRLLRAEERAALDDPDAVAGRCGSRRLGARASARGRRGGAGGPRRAFYEVPFSAMPDGPAGIVPRHDRLPGSEAGRLDARRRVQDRARAARPSAPTRPLRRGRAAACSGTRRVEGLLLYLCNRSTASVARLCGQLLKWTTRSHKCDAARRYLWCFASSLWLPRLCVGDAQISAHRAERRSRHRFALSWLLAAG